MLDRAYLTHEEIMQGGKLVLQMDHQPNKEWGQEKQNLPPSLSH